MRRLDQAEQALGGDGKLVDLDANGGIVVMCIIGQLSVFVVLFWQWKSGAVYLPGLVSGLIDLVFALAFALFLWTHTYPPHRPG